MQSSTDITDNNTCCNRMKLQTTWKHLRRHCCPPKLVDSDDLDLLAVVVKEGDEAAWEGATKGVDGPLH